MSRSRKNVLICGRSTAIGQWKFVLETQCRVRVTVAVGPTAAREALQHDSFAVVLHVRCCELTAKAGGAGDVMVRGAGRAAWRRSTGRSGGMAAPPTG